MYRENNNNKEKAGCSSVAKAAPICVYATCLKCTYMGTRVQICAQTPPTTFFSFFFFLAVQCFLVSLFVCLLVALFFPAVAIFFFFFFNYRSSSPVLVSLVLFFFFTLATSQFCMCVCVYVFVFILCRVHLYMCVFFFLLSALKAVRRKVIEWISFFLLPFSMRGSIAVSSS